MSTISKEWLQKAISQHESMRDEIPFGLDEDDSNTLAALRIALASLEAEPAIHRWRRVTSEPYGPYPWHYGNFIGFSKPVEGIEDEYFYSAPPAPVSVPAAMEMDDDFDSVFEHGKAVGWNACRAARLQGAGPVTIKANGGGSEKDEPPKRGWVVTHSGKDYFYREQGDAATHMNAAVESGIGVSLRSFIPEPVTTAYKLPDEFDFDRFNDVVWLEAVASNPHMHSPTTSTIAMVALELNRKLADGNSPVIPDGWVACSERMPEDDDFVYIWPRPDFGVELHVAQYGKFDKRDAGWYAQVYEQNYGIEYYPVRVTHWMPLPAAPQQEV